MKKIFLLLMLLMLPLVGAAAEAPDLSDQAVFTAEVSKKEILRLTDRKLSTVWQGPRGKGTLAIHSPTPCHGLYVCWNQSPRAFRIEVLQGGQWTLAHALPEQVFQHQYYPLDGVSDIRLVPEKDNGKDFGIQEIYLLGEGDVPAWVQRWQPTVENADLMVFFAHPDDEVLFFGGAIPYYAAERGIKVLPVALSTGSPRRVSELLNCLWSLGQKNYPVLGPFDDRYSFDLDKAYKNAGRRKAQAFITEVYRRYNPKVVVSHDVNGEYGHGMHRLCADLAFHGIQFAADPGRYPESAALWGTHDVQKLYLHLYRERGQDVQLEMDWDRPLSAFGGRSGFDVAMAGYEFHLSQHRYEQYKVEPRDSRRSSYLFGLRYSAVGPDIQKDDFMENVLPD